MKSIVITGSGGLIGSEASYYYLNKGYRVLGIDNNMREVFFGKQGSVKNSISSLKENKNYLHFDTDIRNESHLEWLFKKYKKDIVAVFHFAAQPSHDKAAQIMRKDFEVNAEGTLNVLECVREFCKDVPTIVLSTNKVYGDAPNKLDLIEEESRYEFSDEKYKNGIDESMTIDQSTHSLFGVSKLYGDLLGQEMGKYFNMPIGVFRGGCLTGTRHSSIPLHGFLNYIVKCAKNNIPYKVIGYKGKQVRDQIHSFDVITCFEHFINSPKCGEVYNLGGGKENSASILEIISILKKDFDLKLNWTYEETNRIGDHMCYYTNMDKFYKEYPDWKKQYSLKQIIEDIIRNI